MLSLPKVERTHPLVRVVHIVIGGGAQRAADSVLAGISSWSVLDESRTHPGHLHDALPGREALGGVRSWRMQRNGASRGITST